MNLKAKMLSVVLELLEGKIRSKRNDTITLIWPALIQSSFRMSYYMHLGGKGKAYSTSPQAI